MAIRQKPSGNWEVYYRSPSTGKRVAITFRTEKEAVQKDALIKYQLKNERETLMTEEKTRKRGQAAAAKVEEGTGFEDVVYRYLKAKRYTPESLTPEGEQHDIHIIGRGRALLDGGVHNGLTEATGFVKSRSLGTDSGNCVLREITLSARHLFAVYVNGKEVLNRNSYKLENLQEVLDSRYKLERQVEELPKNLDSDKERLEALKKEYIESCFGQFGLITFNIVAENDCDKDKEGYTDIGEESFQTSVVDLCKPYQDAGQHAEQQDIEQGGTGIIAGGLRGVGVEDVAHHRVIDEDIISIDKIKTY